MGKISYLPIDMEPKPAEGKKPFVTADFQKSKEGDKSFSNAPCKDQQKLESEFAKKAK